MAAEEVRIPERLVVRLLGPFEVTVGGRPVVVTSGRLRTLLSVLAMAAGKTVSVDRLAAAVWDKAPPGNTRRSVQTHVTRLRAAVGSEWIGTTPVGYVLRAEPDDVDALRYVRLVETAAGPSGRTAERARLVEALALWRGTPFDGVPSDWLQYSEAPRLVERYLVGVERRIDLDLADRLTGELVAELSELTARYPLREPLWLRRLIVLDRCGRRAEALEQYGMIRTRLASELGTDPGQELQQVYADLLAGRRLLPAPVVDYAVADRPVPRQLPADIDGFVGRDSALKALRNLISEGNATAAGAVVISVITGTAGVGKTAVAVYWAHEVVDRFPDGQLYVNLRGFHPSGKAMAPAEAVRGFLDALGVPPERIPPDLDAQVGLYRSLLAGKRMLVVLDNARDADQVRPLLPGAPGCLVVVTSRDQLAGLVATWGARSLELDLLSIDEARELLATRLGADRVEAEPDAANEIITRCARLPLALAIAAARVGSRPTFPLSTGASQLGSARSGLDVFSTGELVTDVRAVFSWSYHSLDTKAARLFRLLGLQVGPDVTAGAAASLADLPLDQTRPLLADLTQAHLLVEHAPGRYAFHDLLRSYATELGHSRDTAEDRQAALHRMLDHYLQTAHTAARRLNPGREHITVQSPQPGVIVEPLADHQQALAWLSAEHAVLRATIAHAAGAGFDTHTWQLAWALDDFHFRQGYWHDWAVAQHTALEAAQRIADQPARARAHRVLGTIYARLNRIADAHAHLEHSLDLYDQLGDTVGQAYVHMNLSMVHTQHGRHSDALPHAQQAIDLYHATDHHPADEWDLCADVFSAAGWYYAQIGHYQEALAHCQRGVELNREIGNRTGEACSWACLGHALRGLGRFDRAITCHHRSIDLFHDVGATYHEADARICIGDTHRAAGNTEAARTVWQDALAIFNELGHHDAQKVRAKLDDLNRTES